MKNALTFCMCLAATTLAFAQAKPSDVDDLVGKKEGATEKTGQKFPEMPKSARADHPPAGLSNDMHVTGDPETKYKIFIPPQYEKSPEAQFPLLINHNPSARTNIKPYVAWAEKVGAVIVGIDGAGNGTERGLKFRRQDAIMKDLITRGVRVHPQLAFTIGMSGGSADGMRLIRRKPERYAGSVLMGAGGIVNSPQAKHFAYVILGGAKDEWMNGEACYKMVAEARTLGCPVKLALGIDRQHKEASLEQQYWGMTWLLETQKLRMPTLPEEQRKANLDAARQRMVNIDRVADVKDRLAEAELLIDLEPLKVFEKERDVVGSAWAKALLELAAAETDAVKRHAFLIERGLQMHGRNEALPETASKPVQAAVDALRKDAAVAKDWAIREKYLALAEEEMAAGINPEKLKTVLPKWDELAKSADGEWARTIARRARIVKLFIDEPSTIEKPTKLRD